METIQEINASRNPREWRRNISQSYEAIEWTVGKYQTFNIYSLHCRILGQIDCEKSVYFRT